MGQAPGDPLQANWIGNQWTAALIVTVWGWGIVTLISGTWVLDVTAPYFARQLAVVIALGLLSVISMTFYFRVVIRVRETTIGTVLSIALSLVFVALLYWVPRFPYFTVLSVGAASICTKAGQMYLMARREQIGERTVSYLKRIFIAYLIVSVAAVAVGLLEDSGRISIFPSSGAESDREFDGLRDSIRSLTGVERLVKDRLVEEIDRLRIRLTAAGRQVQILNSVFFVGVIVWVLYRAFIVRGTTLEDIIAELRIHYTRPGS